MIVVYLKSFADRLLILKYISDLFPTTGNLYRSKLDIGSSANYGITGLSEILMILEHAQTGIFAK